MLQSDDPPCAHVPPSGPSPSQLLTDFLRRHRKQLYRGVAAHSGLQPQDREDVVSDTLLGLWKLRAKFDPRRSLFPLAYTIALRKARTRLRQVATARRRLQERSLSDELLERRGSDDCLIELDERRDAVQQFLRRIPRIDRRILEARCVDELPWGRIASLVRMTKTSAIRRYRAVLAEARRVLAAWKC